MARLTFADEFKRLRRESAKTLRDVAVALDVSIPYVSDVEHGRRLPPTPDKIAAMAALCGRPELYPRLRALAIVARGGAIELSTDDEKTRELLVALERRIENKSLDDGAIQKIRNILDGDR